LEDIYIPQYSAMTFLASSLALICNFITKRPKKKHEPKKKITYLISKKYQKPKRKGCAKRNNFLAFLVKRKEKICV